MSKKLFAFIFIISIGTIIFLFGVTWSTPTEKLTPETVNYRPIVISDIDPFKKLEEPAVTFYHEKHVAALKEEGCGECHPYEKKAGEKTGHFNFIFPKERDETSRRALLNSYHDSCIGCHTTRLEEKKESGPIACGECHRPDLPEEWIKPVEFDFGIHNKHEKAAGKKCEVCHHIYDEEQKKLIYKEETESSCRDCHREKDEENRRSMRKVAHADCVNCHLQKEEEGKDAGPCACEKCHLELKPAAIEELADIPRPDRKQPKTTIIE